MVSEQTVNCLPIVAFPLASSVEPVKSSSDLETEFVQASVVVSYPIVMVVANKNLVQLIHNVSHRPCSHCFDALVYLSAFLSELLPVGFPLHSELVAPAFGTKVCKTQESKGFRLATSGYAPVLCCKSTKLQQPALFLLKAQSKVYHSAFQGLVEHLYLRLVLKAYHEVVLIDNKSAVSLHPSADPLLVPLKQDVVQIDVRYDWRAYGALPGTFFCRFKPVVLHDPRFQHPADEPKEIRVVGFDAYEL